MLYPTNTLINMRSHCNSHVKEVSKPNVVISGHTHRPLQDENRGVLYVNPGSAGYPKFGQPATVALLQIKGQSLQAQFVELKD